MKRKSKNVSKKKTEQNKTNEKQEQQAKETAEKDIRQDVEMETDHEKKPDTEQEDWESRYNEINDKYLRLYSEFDNYRKRTIKERLDLAKTASEEVIIDLLPILDDFERAIKSTEEVKNCEPVKEGMNLIYNKLSGMLHKKGLKPIEAIGEEFDTDFHEAITYIPAPSDKLKGKIVDEVQKGYLLHDKVIRYTKVVIGQ